MQKEANIAGWSRRKLIQYIEDNLDQSPAGSVSFLFREDGTLGWLNESGSAVTFSDQGVHGDGTVSSYAVDGNSVELPAAVPDGALFEVSVTDADDPFYVSFRVK